MGLDVNFVDQLIYIQYPQTDLLVQDLIDEVRRAEATVSGISQNKVADASGKELLSSGVFVGITVELHDPWQIRFWDGNYKALVTGGNLVGGPSGDPVAYSPGVQTILLQSTAATLVDLESFSTTPQEIASEVDDVLSVSHGSGNWEGGGGLTESGIALAVDVQLTSTKGGFPWTSLSESGIAYAVDQRLSEFHGSGSWEGGASGGASASEVAAAVWDVQMSAHETSGTAGGFLNFIRDIEGGGWKIDDVTNEMIFYKSDNVTEIARFNIFDKNDNAASEDVYRRDRS